MGTDEALIGEPISLGDIKYCRLGNGYGSIKISCALELFL